MKKLLQRVYRLYQADGLLAVILQSLRFVVGTVHYTLGMRGLYDNEQYRSFITWWNSGRGAYTQSIDPFQIYYVDPKEIEYITCRDPFPGDFMWHHLGLVRGGKWDQSTERFTDLLLYQGLKQRYEDNVSWDDTEFIQNVREEVANGKADWKNACSEAEIEQGCETVDRLYENISQDGYKTMKELVENGAVQPAQSKLPEQLLKVDEVAVDIGRNGEFLFVDGRHRLSIALILGLEEIPIRVVARHKRWQQIRDYVAGVEDVQQLPESIQQHLCHPDLQNILKHTDK